MFFYSIVEIGIREISATNTFAYAYVCLLRYVSNSIGGVIRVTLIESGTFLIRFRLQNVSPEHS